MAVFLTMALAVAAGCSSKDDTGSSDANGSSSAADTAALGTPNKATGTPIKIGLVTDGKTEGIDHTPLIAAFNATVQYANEYLGGINGHVIDVDPCETKNTPTGATQCAVQLAGDKVAAVLVPVSAQDTAIFDGLEGSGIPYFTYEGASQDVLLKPGGFMLTNPLGQIAAPAKLANDKNIDKVGFILIDVPAATGPINAIATPIYDKAGVGLDITPISPSVADMTPQVQQAISGGAGLFTVTGTDEFNANALKSLKQLGFQGPITTGQPSKVLADSVPGGLEGVTAIVTITDDPDDKDVQLYDAVLATYMKDVVPSAISPVAFATVLSFVRALTGVTDAVDAPSITAALNTMPSPLPLPLGAGITFQCGAKPVALTPNVCSSDVLSANLDAAGQGHDYTVLDVSDYLTLG